MAQEGENAGLMDIKKNLRRLYELLSISVMDNREMARVKTPNFSQIKKKKLNSIIVC